MTHEEEIAAMTVQAENSAETIDALLAVIARLNVERVGLMQQVVWLAGQLRDAQQALAERVDDLEAEMERRTADS